LIESPGCKIELASKVHWCKSSHCSRQSANASCFTEQEVSNCACRSTERAPTPLSGQNSGTRNAKAARPLAGKATEPASGVRSITQGHQRTRSFMGRCCGPRKGGFRFPRSAGDPFLEPGAWRKNHSNTAARSLPIHEKLWPAQKLCYLTLVRRR
jgi:hypothetical protein